MHKQTKKVNYLKTKKYKAYLFILARNNYTQKQSKKRTSEKIRTSHPTQNQNTKTHTKHAATETHDRIFSLYRYHHHYVTRKNKPELPDKVNSSHVDYQVTISFINYVYIAYLF